MMDNSVDERDYKLLEADKYTFFVLKRIMDGKEEKFNFSREDLTYKFDNIFK